MVADGAIGIGDAVGVLKLGCGHGWSLRMGAELSRRE
jgi:hypothetical protein